MKSKASQTIGRVTFGVGLFLVCGSAFAGDAGQLIQGAALVLSYIYPAFAPVFLAIAPVVGQASSRRKERGNHESR